MNPNDVVVYFPAVTLVDYQRLANDYHALRANFNAAMHENAEQKKIMAEQKIKISKIAGLLETKQEEHSKLERDYKFLKLEYGKSTLEALDLTKKVSHLTRLKDVLKKQETELVGQVAELTHKVQTHEKKILYLETMNHHIKLERDRFSDELEKHKVEKTDACVQTPKLSGIVRCSRGVQTAVARSSSASTQTKLEPIQEEPEEITEAPKKKRVGNKQTRHFARMIVFDLLDKVDAEAIARAQARAQADVLDILSGVLDGVQAQVDAKAEKAALEAKRRADVIMRLNAKRELKKCAIDFLMDDEDPMIDHYRLPGDPVAKSDKNRGDRFWDEMHQLVFPISCKSIRAPNPNGITPELVNAYILIMFGDRKIRLIPELAKGRYCLTFLNNISKKIMSSPGVDLLQIVSWLDNPFTVRLCNKDYEDVFGKMKMPSLKKEVMEHARKIEFLFLDVLMQYSEDFKRLELLRGDRLDALKLPYYAITIPVDGKKTRIVCSQTQLIIWAFSGRLRSHMSGNSKIADFAGQTGAARD